MTFITRTDRNETMIHEFNGAEPGYVATSQMLVGCALHLLKESDCLPVKYALLNRSDEKLFIDW